MMGLGKDRNVYAKRLLFIFEDGVCVYPAQNLEHFNGIVIQQYQKIRFDDHNYVIERNTKDYFDSGIDKNENFMTIWAPLKQYNGIIDGLIGLQLS